jgi:Fe-coproporphyrin III synthase
MVGLIYGRGITDLIRETPFFFSMLKKYAEKQLSLMKGNWGGVGTTPIQSPSWRILSLDHMGRIKQPCCTGSADSKGLKPICEQSGLGCYSVLVANGITGS